MRQTCESLLSCDETPVARAIALDEPAGAPVGEPLLQQAHPLYAVAVRLQVCVGEAAMTVGQLLQAQENAVLALDRRIDQPVDLLLEGRVVARGRLVAVDDRFGVAITELPQPLAV